jgi:hypothetical protein
MNQQIRFSKVIFLQHKTTSLCNIKPTLPHLGNDSGFLGTVRVLPPKQMSRYCPRTCRNSWITWKALPNNGLETMTRDFSAWSRVPFEIRLKLTSTYKMPKDQETNLTSYYAAHGHNHGSKRHSQNLKIRISLTEERTMEVRGQIITRVWIFSAR